MNKRRFEQAFALPTVVITAVILMMLLVGGLSSVTSVRRGLNEQYYASIAREAAEAGLVYAQSCITKNLTDGATSGWGFSSTTTLKMGMNCSGAYPSGVNCDSAPTVTPNQCYVYYDPTANPGVRSSFVVGALQTLAGGSYTINVTSNVSLYNGSGAAYKSYPTTQQKRISIDPHIGLVTGNDTSCSIQYGKLYCWGKNNSGQVGNGSLTDVLAPILVQGALADKYVHAVMTGMDHTCAVTGPSPIPSANKFASDPTVSSKVYCWGDNSQGQYGNAATAEVLVPSDTAVVKLTDKYATAISGRDHTCIITKEISNPALSYVYCWGDNNQNQAGRSTNCTTASNADTPNPKAALGCAIRWNNATNDVLATNVQINGVTNGSTCGILTQEGNIAWCIGNADWGALGNGDVNGTDLPRASRVRTTSGEVVTGMTKVAENNGRACGLAYYALTGSDATIGKVFCWGQNADDQGTNVVQYRIDSRLTGIQYGYALAIQTNRVDTTYQFFTKNVTDFGIADWNTCFIVAGEVYCSGYNNRGQLGQGDTNGPDGLPSVAPTGASTVPAAKVRSMEWAAKVQGALVGKVAVELVGGNNHFCAITSDKDVYCWGANDVGQLGDGTTTDRTLPVKASIPRNITY